jgi:hypothetical protein
MSDTFGVITNFTLGTGGTISITNTYTAGSTLVCFVGDDDTTSGAAPSGMSEDTNSKIDGSGNAWWLRVFIQSNIAGGSMTKSYTSLSSSGPTMAIVEILGPPASGAVHVSSGSANNALANPDLAVAALAGEALIAVIIDQRSADTVASSTGSGGLTWSDATGGTAEPINGLQYKLSTVIAPSNGTYGPAWTGVASGRTNSLWTGSFKVAAPAGGFPRPDNGEGLLVQVSRFN